MAALALDASGHADADAAAARCVRAAERCARDGADEVCLRGESVAADPLIEVVRALAAALPIPLLIQTGLDRDDEIGRLVAAGASRIAIRTQALRDPDRIAELVGAFGPEAVSVAVVARREDGHWRVLEGAAAPATEWDAIDWCRVIESQGGAEVIVRAIGASGAPEYDLDLLGRLGRALHIPVLVDGEPDGPEAVFDVLMLGDADGVLIDGRSGPAALGPRAVKRYLSEHGLEVRG